MLGSALCAGQNLVSTDMWDERAVGGAVASCNAATCPIASAGKRRRLDAVSRIWVRRFLSPDRPCDIGPRSADASDATSVIAMLQERYDIGALDWTLIDASGAPEDTLELCRSAIPCP